MSIGSGNGLTPNRRNAITWTNVKQDAGLEELTHEGIVASSFRAIYIQIWNIASIVKHEVWRGTAFEWFYRN